MQGQEYAYHGERTMYIRKINPLSLGKVMCVVWAGLGLIGGLLYLLIAMAFAGIMQQAASSGGAPVPGMGAMFAVSGIMGIFVVGIAVAFYAFIGFIFGLIAALLYNMVGG